MSRVAEMEEEDLIKIEEEVEKTQLSTFIFEEAEEELTKLLILEDGEETDGALDLIVQIVQKIRHQIEKEDFGEALIFIHFNKNLYPLTEYKGRHR